MFAIIALIVFTVLMSLASQGSGLKSDEEMEANAHHTLDMLEKRKARREREAEKQPVWRDDELV